MGIPQSAGAPSERSATPSTGPAMAPPAVGLLLALAGGLHLAEARVLLRRGAPDHAAGKFVSAVKSLDDGLKKAEKVARTDLTEHEKAAKKAFAKAPAPAIQEARSDRFTGDPALSAVASSGKGDYYSVAWTGENAGDPKRGTGSCTAFRRTLNCNPSGPRHPEQDRGCAQVIASKESGFCECGDFAQFAAVDCDHRPFTCEVMCLKFAVVSGRQAYFHGKSLPPAQAKAMLDNVMWANQTDLEAMRIMTKEVEDFMGRAMQYTSDSGKHAVDSMKKWIEMMKEVRVKGATKAEKEMEEYRQMIKDRPWVGIYDNGRKMIDAGQGIQRQVKKVLPFDPLVHSDHLAI